MSGLTPFRTTNTLPTFPPDLYQKTRHLLLASGYCESEQRLRNLFVDARIRPFLNQLPNTHSPDERARATINHLTRQTGQGGGNGLVLFIAVLMDMLPTQDALHYQARALHKKLNQINWADYNRLSDVPDDENGRLRQNFINNVHRTWIEGVLHNAVHHDIYLTLGMAYQPEAVSQLWQSRLLPENEPVPEAVGIYDLFVQNGRSLLILGAPASGKTITLLQLCEQLLQQVATVPHAPLPVVLNLSSWQGEEFEQWLVEAIFLQYGLARSVGQRWLKDNHLVLLLDGLDEVAKERRDACIEAINGLRGDYPIEIVVCSRTDDYKVLEKRLQVATAVHIDPITLTQVQSYLTQFGERTTSLRQSLQANEQLQELAESPLMLSLMVLTYESATPEQMPTIAEQRTRLFERYVGRVFLQRPLPDGSPYSESQSLTWLTNLAKGMKKHEQSIFHIESLQLTWLTSSVKVYYFLSLFLLSGVFFISIYGTISLLTQPIIGIITGLIVLARLRFIPKNIELFDSLEIVFFRKNLRSITQTLLVSGSLYALLFRRSQSIVSALIFGMLIGAFLDLLSIAFIPIKKIETAHSLTPNQQIHSAVRNAVVGGIGNGLFGTSFIFVGGVFGGWFGENIIGLHMSLLIGALVGLLVGGSVQFILGVIQYGGVPIVKHYSLRYWLAKSSILPYPFSDKKLVRFLDNMAERMLLRRVGGGWIFIHRYLLEYFASLHPDNETTLE